jgi:hypothetical protein
VPLGAREFDRPILSAAEISMEEALFNGSRGGLGVVALLWIASFSIGVGAVN